MNQHITAEQAGRWVSGLLEGEEALQLEAHAVECPPCTVVLQGEAQAEHVLRDAVAANRGRGQVVPLRSRRTQVTPVLLALAALAATALFLVKPLFSDRPPRAQSEPAMSFTLVESSGSTEPLLEMEVPRYEDGHAVPEIGERARGPFPL